MLYTMDTLSAEELVFFGKQTDLLPAYLCLRSQVVSLLPEMEVRTHKTQVSFRAPRPFAWVQLSGFRRSPGVKGSHMILSLAASAPIHHPSVSVNAAIRPGLYTVHTLVPPQGQLDQAMMDYLQAALVFRNPNPAKSAGADAAPDAGNSKGKRFT